MELIGIRVCEKETDPIHTDVIQSLISSSSGPTMLASMASSMIEVIVVHAKGPWRILDTGRFLEGSVSCKICIQRGAFIYTVYLSGLL